MLTFDNDASCSLRNVSSSRNSPTSLFAAAIAPSLSANWSLSSFSRFKNSSRSSLSRPTTVGVAGLLSVPSDLSESSAGIAGVWLRVDEGVGDAGVFLGATMGLSDVTHSAWSTEPPDRQMAISASSAAMYFWYCVFAALALESRCLSSAGESSWLTRALFLIDFARIPNRRVESVSASLYAEGEQLMMSVVLELPPSDSWRIRVSFESRYGMCLA